MASVSRSVEAQASAQIHTPKSLPGRLSLIAVSLFVSTFVSDGKLAKLPLQFLLKDHLHVTPTLMAAFFGLTGLAWYFKPLAGLLSDAVPLFGSRRRNYLLVSGLGAGLLWALLGIVPHRYGPVVWTLVAANAFAVLASSVSGGLLVEEGQRQGLTGRLGSLRETIIAGSSLLAQPVGGFLAERAFGWTCGIGAALFFGLIPAALCLLPRESAVVRESSTDTLKAQMGPVFRARGLWLATAFIFLKELSPGFGTPLFYYQTNTLHFSKLFLGGLGAVFNGAAVAGALVYALVCLRLPLGRLLPGAIILSAVSALLFLGYHSHSSALIVQGVSGFLGIFASVALMDLAARTTPVGGEAMGYSLLMSAFNLGLTCSDILGAWLYGHFHLSFAALVWMSAGTTLLALPLMRLIPAEALTRHDR